MAQFVVIKHDWSQGEKAKKTVVGRASTAQEAIDLLQEKKAEQHRDGPGESVSFTWEEEKTSREDRSRRLAHYGARSWFGHSG